METISARKHRIATLAMLQTRFETVQERRLAIMLIDIFENEMTDQQYDDYTQRLAEFADHRKET